MQKKRLGSSDLYLTTVGFGTWGMSGSGWRGSWGAQDDSESIKSIIKGYELGINWIDTAPVYGFGHSEEIVGKAIKELQEKPIIATKLGLRWDNSGNVTRSLTEASVREEVDNSLRRLGVDAIDLYQIHWPIDNNEDEVLEGWATISKLIQEGKVRYAGVCNFGIDLLDKICDIHPVTSAQSLYNMVKRGIEKDILPYCRENNIGVVCYSPMGKGLLTGAFSKERAENLTDEDHRKRTPDFQEPMLSITLDMVDELRHIAERNARTMAQLAIAWTLRKPEVTSAIVGVRRPSQTEETAPAGDWTLSQEDITAIDQILTKYEARFAEIPPPKSVL